MTTTTTVAKSSASPAVAARTEDAAPVTGPSLWRREWPWAALGVAVFAAMALLPVGWGRFDAALDEALLLTRWYAREHVVLCLLPAFFIAGAIGVFVRQGAVMKYLGPAAPKPVAYGVASVSGTVLAVCSCTVLPLFAGIWRMGAGLGPAVAFLYAGPSINVLAIILTARVLGLELGVARAVAAVGFSVVIGLAMHLIYRKQERRRAADAALQLPDEPPAAPLHQTLLHFGALLGVLVFANWAEPTGNGGWWGAVAAWKWPVAAGSGVLLGVVLVAWHGVAWWKVALTALATAATWLALATLRPAAGHLPLAEMAAFAAATVGLTLILSTGRRTAESEEWAKQSWGFAKQIAPLLLAGVLVAGFLLGRPGHEGLIPGDWVAAAVGGNSLRANLLASVLGAFMYFATLTEVPILQGLIGSGMGKGPALALLLAGPALSLPSMLVLRSVMGTQKTIVYVALVVVLATLSGVLYGAWF